ncbi:unnamed protein product [Absidia cylindrospora]
MAYFTSRHTTTSTEQGGEIGNKDEKQPLLSDGSRTQYHSTSPKQSTDNIKQLPYYSSCTTPTDGADILLSPFKRLAHLRRTTWSDQSSSSASPVDQCYEDTPTPIQLPSFHFSPHNNSSSLAARNQNNTIAYELHWMITWTLFACLLCPIGATVIVFTSPESNNHYTWMQQSLQPLLVVFWSLLVVFWKHHPEKIQSFLHWAQNACLITMLSFFTILGLFDATPEYIYILVAVLSVSLCLFYVARRLDLADERQRLWFQQRLRDQHSFAQRLINDQTYVYSQRRMTFLSTVTNEIQDAVLMILTTLEQFSPAIVLNNTQELLSACSIAVPITSISAIHTTVKQVYHISSHLQLMSCLVQESNNSDNNKTGINDNSCETDSSSTSTKTQLVNNMQSQIRQPFDIGDLLQNSGDALAGMASKLDVNMVLYHFDNKLHHTRVIGDENAFRHALLNLLRNLLEGSTPGACIEVGLNLVPVEGDNSKMIVILDTTHTCSPAIPEHLSSASILLPNANLTSQLIRYIGGHLSVCNLSNKKTRFEMVVKMDLASKNDDHLLFISDTPTQTSGTNTPLLNSYHHIKFANEPTMKDLSKFMENLRGLKMVLHAKEQSVFAKHLTGCLASWNSDISHVPVSRLDDSKGSMMNETNRTPDSDGNTSSSTPPTSSTTESVTDYQQRQQKHHAHNHPHHRHHQMYSTVPLNATTGPTSTGSTPSSKMSSRPTSTNIPHVPSPATEEEHLLAIPPAFILIDDNIMTLEHKLLEFRTHPPVSAIPAHGRRHKHMKSNQTVHHHGPTTAIIHFTSLINYKRVRDTIQWASTLSTPFAMPRLIVVPKPAGPRRYLTALHTVWHEAMVEPHFIPIATSPGSPVPTVLLSSMLSQVIEQPSSITPPTPNSDQVLSSSNQQHHRPRRPTSGAYSPSTMYTEQLQQQQHEGSNYFFDRSGIGGNLVQTSAGSHLHNDNKGLRRRSLREISEAMSQGAEIQQDNSNINSGILDGSLECAALSPLRRTIPLLTSSAVSPTYLIPSISSSTKNADAHGIPMMAATDGLATETPEVPAISSSTTEADINTCNKVSSVSTNPTNVCGSSLEGTLPLTHLPVVTPTVQEPLSTNADVATVGPSNDNSNNNNSSSTAASHSDHLSASNTKTEPSKPMSRMASIKLNKRKKKEKGSPFANVVSPPINVLIVEDNMINQAILSAWMKKHKIKFSVASNGQEAVEKWKGGGFHLILMDIQLPVMSGIDATKMIRSIEKEQRIGVLPMSSSFLRQQQQRQANDSMDTPVDATDMIHPTASPSPSSSSSPSSLTSTTLPDSQLSTTPSTFRSPVIIVALTASSLESDRHAALAAGCNDFLTKPVSLEWLEKKIIEWGCMQALIDFEGWRRWKRTAHDEDVSSWANKVNKQGNGTGADAPPPSSSSSFLHRNGRLPTPGIHSMVMGGRSSNGVTISTDVVGQDSFSGQDTLSPLPPPSAGSTISNISDLSSHMVDNSGNTSDGKRKGILLPGAVGLNKRRFSTVDKQSLRRHNTTSGSHYYHHQQQQQQHNYQYPSTPINRATSFSKLPIQKSYSESVTGLGIRRKVTKKAVSMDDTMRAPTSVG